MKNISKCLLSVMKGLSILLIVILLYVLFINQDEDYYSYACFFISLAILYPTIKLVTTYSRYFINYIFSIKNDWWIKEIERPRLFFNLSSIFIIIIILFYIIPVYGRIAHNLVQELFLGILWLFIPIMLLITFSTWTRLFEKILEKIRHRLYYKSIECIFMEKRYDTKATFDILIKEDIECEYSIFLDLINLYIVESSKRIIWKSDKVKLIRLIFIGIGV